ncbi:DUF7718 family protein [Nocardia africana]
MKRELSKSRKTVSESLESPHGSYEAPNRQTCQSHQWEVGVDDLYTIRLQFNIWRRDGRLVDFTVNVERLSSTGWVSEERFDCCHGHCHVHVDNDEDKPRSIHTLDTVDDVEEAFRKVEEIADERARIMRDKGA